MNEGRSSPAQKPLAAALMPARRRLTSRLAPFIVTLALISALATFMILAGFSPIRPTNEIVRWLFSMNGLIILVLLGLILAEALNLIAARRAGAAGARLHIRIVSLFAIVAAIPAFIIATVAAVTLERSLNPAFMQDARAVMVKTAEAARSYRETQCETLLREGNLTASDLDHSAALLTSDPALFHDYFASRVKFLGFTTAALLKRDGQILDRIDGSKPVRVVQPQPSDFGDAEQNQKLCLELEQGRVFVVLRALPTQPDTFLYIARRLGDLASADLSVSATNLVYFYDAYANQRHTIEFAFATMYALLALIMLLSAVWLALSFANRLVAPIRRLIHATDQVSSGNLYVQVAIKQTDGDLANLGKTFNKMTSELRLQQNRLMAANALIDERRLFTEAVLSGVPAVVIGVDSNDAISVVNASAGNLLETMASYAGDPVGTPILKLVPELAPLIDKAREGRARLFSGQLSLTRNGRDRVFNVRVAVASAGKPERGYVVTLDDITDLVSAQRTSAWADVARRIAHEIRNPLTPIQLSAERLKRKYGKLITQDRAIFDQCTDTIIRQVDDIKRMVDEFSSFARMPKARLENEDIRECVRQVIFLMASGDTGVAIEEKLPEAAMFVRFDRRLMSRALTNVIKNAIEGIGAKDDHARTPGRITVGLRRDADDIVSIDVVDNGIGFPAENRQRLLEPYMTTRSEGTGLGLAIVAKILEDHGGGIDLLDASPAGSAYGAHIRLHFPAGGVAPPKPRDEAAPETVPDDEARREPQELPDPKEQMV